MVGNKAVEQLRRTPPVICSEGEAEADFPAHGISQLLPKALLRSEFIFSIDNRHSSRSASAPRSVKSG